MSRRGILTFTCRKTSSIYVWLTELFFFRRACGNGGGTLIFTSFLLPDCSSCGGSATVGVDLTRAGTAGLSSLPRLKVTTALTSSILTFGSLVRPISCTPLCCCCDWKGTFPIYEPCGCWLDNLEISECILSSFLYSELSTASIFWLV